MYQCVPHVFAPVLTVTGVACLLRILFFRSVAGEHSLLFFYHVALIIQKRRSVSVLETIPAL